MNILYLIATFKHSRGGHYYSLKTIAEAMSQHTHCRIINIGIKENKILESGLFNTYHVKFNGLNYVQVCRRIMKLLKDSKPDVIHSFDNNTLAVSKILSHFYRIPVIYTKCGGPNPKRLFSFVKYMIVFQKENEVYIRNMSKDGPLQLFLFPNRVNEIPDDNERLDLLKRKIDNRTVFLRISRIGKSHELNLIQSINLIRQLHNDGFPVQLLIIGYVEDTQIFNKLKSIGSDEYLTFITEDYFTYNANTLINIADFVIGTGRGLMEAASKSKILLTSQRDAKIPVLITKDNFETLFYYNFSNRSSIPDYSEDENYERIKELINDRTKSAMQKQFSLACYQRYFSIKTVIPDYLKLYSEAQYEAKPHFMGFLKSIYIATKVCLYWKAQEESEN